MNIEKVCCFFGHRKIDETPELKEKIVSIVENLIMKRGVDTFLFGSKSEFNSLCYNVVSKMKESYPHIKRVNVRAFCAEADGEYISFLLSRYEMTFQPENIFGKASYVQRNREMINMSKYCIVYYDVNYLPPRKKGKKLLHAYQPESGTAVAHTYAMKKGKEIINVFDD